MPLGFGISLQSRAIAAGLPGTYYDFTGSTLPSPWDTLRRAGLGTRIDAAGAVGYGAHNLITQSVNLNAVPWQADRVTVSSGTVTCDGTGSSFAGLETPQFAYVVGLRYTTRWSLRSGTRDFCQLWFGGGANVSTATRIISGPGSIAAPGTNNVRVSGLASTPTVVEVEWVEAIGPHLTKLYPGNWTAQVVGDSVIAADPAISAGSGPITYVPTTTAPVYLPLPTHDPVTLAALGLQIQGQATQLAQSGNLGAAFITQTKTVTAVAHTISFYGTGSVVLSGVHSATVNGTGTNVLTSLTFTPSAGILTMTVSGTVTDGQLETGTVATSRIPNPGTGTALRTGDFAGGGISGAALTALLTPTQPFTLVLPFRKSYTLASVETLLGLCAGASAGTTNQLGIATNGTQAQLVHSGGSGALTGTLVLDGSVVNRVAVSVDPANARASISVNGSAPVETTGIAYTGAGTTALIPGARDSSGGQPATGFTSPGIRVASGYITGSALQQLSQ